MARLNKVLRQIAIKKTQLRAQKRIAIVGGFDGCRLQASWAGKDWTQVLFRQAEFPRVIEFEDEKLIAPRGDATPDLEEVGQHGAVAAAGNSPIVGIRPGQDRPLPGIAQLGKWNTLAARR